MNCGAYSNTLVLKIDLRSDVKIANLHPIHRYIDESEYKQIQLLCQRYEWHDIPYWDVTSVIHDSFRKIVCPPIIEKHGGKWIIADGLARIYTARQMGLSTVKAVVIESPSEPPVGSVWNWDQIRVTSDSSYSKVENFKSPNLKRWRQLDSFHKSLSNVQR